MKNADIGAREIAIYARIGVVITVIIFWGLFGSPFFGVILVLLMAFLTLIRYREKPYAVLPFLEAAVVIGFAFYWLPSLLALWLPIISFAEHQWALRGRAWFARDYEDRTARLQLETLINETARDSQNAARLAEMSERARIAQDIHDHVGHELHGALIAVQAAQKLYEKDDPRAGEMLSQSIHRLEDAAATLRETVHNLKPAYTQGPDILADICAAFTFCPVRYTASGDLGRMVHWALLAAGLKELLTNIARHSAATQAEVRLDGNKDYIRMTVSDNGKGGPAEGLGLGISGMKERLRSLGGMLTVSAGGAEGSTGFRVVCILPKTE